MPYLPSHGDVSIALPTYSFQLIHSDDGNGVHSTPIQGYPYFLQFIDRICMITGSKFQVVIFTLDSFKT